MVESRWDETRNRILTGARIAFAPGAEADDRKVEAEWLMDALRSGVAINIENAIVVGSFRLRGARITADVRLVSCEMSDFADFSYATFERTLRLEHCSLTQGACFDSVRFRSDVWFDGTVFGMPEDLMLADNARMFNDANFEGVLSASKVHFAPGTPVFLQRVRFASSVYLHDAIFDAEMNFWGARFAGGLSLQDVSIRKACTLTDVKVDGALTLAGTHAGRKAHVSLARSEIARGLDLTGARFFGDFNAAGASIGAIEASNVVFARACVLDEAVVKGSATFTKTRFGRRFGALWRRLAVGGQLDLSQTDFRGGLVLEGGAIADTLFGVGARFRRWSNFARMHASNVTLSDTRFESKSYSPQFANAVVPGTFNMQRARLRAGVSMRKATVGDVDFSDAKAFGLIDCSAMQVSGDMSFQGARLRTRDVALNLQGVTVACIATFDGARIAGKVDAIGLHVGMQLSWNRVKALDEVDFYELRVDRGVFIQSAMFRGALRLNRALLTADLHFSGTVCEGLASFSGAAIGWGYFGPGEAPYDRAACFRGGVEFRRARLDYINFSQVVVGNGDDEADAGGTVVQAAFDRLRVKGVASFTGAKLQALVSFYGAVFEAEALFQYVEFAGEITNFNACMFESRAVFWGVEFKAVEFSYSTFRGAAIFRCMFGRRSNFDMAKFLGPVEFSEMKTVPWNPYDVQWTNPHEYLPASYMSDASFVHASFAGDARFDSTRFAGELDLREASFVALFLPRLAGSARDDTLPERIGLVGCSYHRLSISPAMSLLFRGSELRLSGGYDRQPFSELESALRRSGDERSADLVYLSGRRAERRTKSLVGKSIDYLYGLFLNYGIRPWRLVSLAAVVLLLASWYFHHPGTVEPKDRADRGKVPHRVSALDAAEIALAQFLPVALPVKEQLVLSSRPAYVVVPFRRAPIATNPRHVGTGLQILGWFLVPLGVASASGILVRKK